MEKAVKRIDELQNEVIEQSKKIDGAEEYVKMKMELFEKDQILRKQLKELTIQEQNLTNSFFNLLINKENLVAE
jgi:seryl-tRNA synthetase